MRLNKFLALCGLGSRRSVERLVREGRVTLNGAVVADLARYVARDDQVAVDGNPVCAPRGYSYLMFHKPVGVICTRSDPQGRKTIYQCLPEIYAGLRYVGRLDIQSRGLLLMTNDGDLLHRLTHPLFGVPRTYLVWTRRPLSAREQSLLLQGVDLGELGIARAVSVKNAEKKTEITLTEGKNREIRRMMEAIGHEVRDLKRVAWGPLRLGQLPPGAFRDLTEPEIGSLYAMANMD